MAYKESKDSKRIVINGWSNGISASPHTGLGDIKGANISSINGEVSVAYSRVRLDQALVTGGTMSLSGTSTYGYSGVLTVGTWILVNSHTGTPGTTDGNYYFVKPIVSGVSYSLWSDFGVTQITGTNGATINFTTLAMGVPIDYTYEQNSVSGGGTYRYYILDQNGIIWVSGTSTNAGVAAVPSSTMTWAAITPHGNTAGGIDTFDNNEGSIAIMYSTNSNNQIQSDYLICFTQGDILYGKNIDKSGWPSNTGSSFTSWKTLNYSGGFSHHAMLANDQVMYFCDGPGIGIVQQKTGQIFNPADPSTYNYVDANYLLAPNDAVNRLSAIPSGNGLSIIAGTELGYLYIYPTYQNSTATGAAPTTLLQIPEANVQYLLQANNYVLIFAGNKGNIYLTNGSSITPILTVPDYIAGSVNFVQDPYFIWGGAAYVRGRIFFSIKDQTGSHTGNCGGVWSFVPSFSYYPNQDVGLGLRMENASSLYGTQGFNGYAPVIFSGQELTAQQANGPQYVAAWAQSVNSVDFSGTTPLTNSSTIIETDVMPLGTFLEPRTLETIELKFAAPLATGESAVVNYRTSLESAWAIAGDLSTESVPTGSGSPLSRIIQNLKFQAVQNLQLQIILTSTASSPSWCRLQEIILR